MCEVRIVYMEEEEKYRIDIAGYQNQVQCVAMGGMSTAETSSQTWHKLTGWKIVQYTEETKTIKELKPVLPGGGSSSGNHNN